MIKERNQSAFDAGCLVLALTLVACIFSCHGESISSLKATKNFTDDQLGEVANDEIPYPNQEVDLRGRFTGIAKNLYTEQIYRQTANDRIAALNKAIVSCRQFAFQEAGCVGIRTYSTTLLPTSYGEGFGSWNCFAETNPITGDAPIIRTWMGDGKTAKEAEKSSMEKCRFRSGSGCRVVRCFNEDLDKIS